ncbi:MAG: type II secretion system F family protein [Candidatus Moranbacteria bacterium]|jgi:type IV pilus assembly protein PilC|nr:type II secretion system F family protein [Candidatus Moranbacteria bacterium]
MKFVFKAKNERGQVREGMVEATDLNAAAGILERNGLVPISINEEKKAFGVIKALEKMWEGVSQKELVMFFQQLSTLIEAHVPVVSALRTIEDQTSNRFFRIILKEMADDIEDGIQFSVAIEKHPDVFTTLTMSMIRSGETSGELQRSIDTIAKNIEKNYQLAAKIKGALYYPAFVIAVALVMGFLVVTFILPKITLMIKELNVPVPWYTSFLVWLGDFMSVYWWAVLLIMVAGLGGMVYYARSSAGRREWEQIILKLPVIGNLSRSIYITRFSENFGALLEGGIPVVRALIITSQVVGNGVFEKIILKAADEVKTGGTISTVFLQSKEFPPIVAQMIRIGEETGSLATVLISVAKFYNQEVEITTKSLTTLIEPILIVVLGIGVGILVIGVLMPIYNIAGQI